jgi:hypothetical protein
MGKPRYKNLLVINIALSSDFLPRCLCKQLLPACPIRRLLKSIRKDKYLQFNKHISGSQAGSTMYQLYTNDVVLICSFLSQTLGIAATPYIITLAKCIELPLIVDVG